MGQISLRQLRIFSEVAHRENLSEACEALGLSRPTLSEALRDLEASLGRALFDRSGRRLRLNPAGRALLPDAARVVQDVEALTRRHADRRLLAIGASVTVGNYFLAPLLARLRSQMPTLDVTVTIRNTAATVEALRALEIEVAFVEGAVSHPELRVLPWRRDEQAIVAAPSHSLADAARIEDLAQAGWVLREKGSGTREAFDEAAETWPFEPHAAVTVGGNELLKRAVADGLGLGCLSLAAVQAEIARGELVRVRPAGVAMHRTLSLVSPPESPGPIPPALAAMMALCQESADPEFAEGMGEALARYLKAQ